MRRTLLGALAALLLCPAAAEAAPDTVVDFDGLTTNTEITNQYDGVGVAFGPAASFGVPQPDRTCGAPYARPGIAGQSANIACATGPNEFPDRKLGTAFEFSTERRAVSFDLQQRILATLQVGVRFYAIGGTLLNQQVVTLNRDQTTRVAYSHPTTSGGVAGVVVYSPTGQLTSSDAGPLLLDNLTATLDDVPPPKKFSLALATPSIEVVEGSTAAATLSVRRFNGSNGNVTIDVGALPGGILGAQVTPNPTAGKNPLTLTVSADRPFTGSRQLQVTASGDLNAGQAIGTTLTQTVTGVPAVTIPTGGRFPIRLVPGCGKQPYTDSISVRGDFVGSVGIAALNGTGGLVAQSVDGSFAARGNGAYPVRLALDPGTSTSGGTFELVTRPSRATEQRLTESWIADPLTVASATASLPRPFVAGEQHVRVTGHFPSSCVVTFRDRTGQTWPVTAQDATNPDDGSPVQDVQVLDPPPTGVSGPLQVVGANGAVLATTPSVELRDFRSVFALSKANSGDGARGDYSWDDFERTFGDDDTDACFGICVRDPIAADYYDKWSADVRSGGGLCAGYTLLAMRFRGFQGASERPADYQPGETRAWRVAPVTDGTAVKRDVVRWFVAQNDKAFMKARDAALSRSAADERTYLRDLVNEAGAAYVSIRSKKGGHALVAYALRNAPGGGLVVSVADPNIPYTAAEGTDATLRTTNLAKATITINADGSWSGSSLGWSGANDTLGIVGMVPAQDASLPSEFSLASLWDGSAGGPTGAPAAVTQITTGGKAILDRDGVPASSSGVDLLPQDSGVAAEPQYELPKGRSYDLTIRGDGTGRYEHALLGDGVSAAVKGVRTARGQSDHVVVRPGRAALGFSTGSGSAPITLDLAGRHGKATRTASIQLTARKGGQDDAQLGGSTLRLEHRGAPTTARVTLGSVGEALPGSVVSAPFTIGTGQTVELTPRSWRALDRGVALTVKRGGRVVRRGTLRLVASKVVKLAEITAKRKGTKVVVTGRVVKRGAAPVLTVTIGGKTRTLRGARVRKGRFTLAVTAPGRAATVQLLDEASGLATTRRQVVIRR